MNATELFHENGKSAGVFYCQQCKIVQRTFEKAEQCCRPYACTDCGCEIPRNQYRLTCTSCSDARIKKLEAAKFDKAEKLEVWDGWIFVPGYGPEYFEGLMYFLEWMEEQDEDEEKPMPAYAWACQPCYFAHVTVRDIVDRIADSGDVYEDFDADDLAGLDELEKALAVFNEKNRQHVAWYPNRNKAVLIKREQEKV